MTAASAHNSPFSSSSSIENEQRAHQPSMEEILASIRKIIADDEAIPITRTHGIQNTSSSAFGENAASFDNKAPVITPEQRTSSVAPHALEATAPSLRTISGTVAQKPFASIYSSPSVSEPHDQSVVRTGNLQGLRAQTEDEFRPVPSARSYGTDEPSALNRFSDAAAPAADPAGAEAIEAGILAITSSQFEQGHAGTSVRSFRSAEASGMKTDSDFAAQSNQTAPSTLFVHEPSLSDATILSEEANASVASSFQALSASVLMSSSDMIEGAVRDLLRPMLKQWLDDNLPVMVERMVRAEIERVARGGR